jgi:hypothetical protein
MVQKEWTFSAEKYVRKFTFLCTFEHKTVTHIDNVKKYLSILIAK